MDEESVFKACQPSQKTPDLRALFFWRKVCRGIFITAGRAGFVWIAPAVKQKKKPRRRAKNARRTSNPNDAKIHVTEEFCIDHPNFLRVLASFLVQSFAIDLKDGVEAANLLGIASDHSGFCHGPTQQQKHALPKDKVITDPSKGLARGNTAFAMAIPQMSQLPNLKEESIIATTLGRQRRGKVIGTHWHGISAAVKIIYMDDSNDGDRQYAQDLFRTEVEAYRVAGASGLWGIAVPAPLFVVNSGSLCAIGMVAGVPMPLDPLEWTTTDLQQAKESLLLLHHQAGITLTDIKPANFVQLQQQSCDDDADGNAEETMMKQVVAIDLEGFWKDASEVELPLWLLGQGTPSLI